jgi:peptidoglycan hydrolase-like protein with peptidoglycan-binding domain
MRRRTPAIAGAIIALVALAAPATVAAAEPGGHTTTHTARADWSAGPVARGTGYARAGGSRRVREVQRRLRAAGYRTGPLDGLYGPRTERAVQRFQRDAGLAPDAVAGRRTLRALRTRGDTARSVRPAPAPAPIATALPVPPAPVAAPAAAPDSAPLPLTPVLAALAALGLVVAVSSYARTRRRVLRGHVWPPPRGASGTGGRAG